MSEVPQNIREFLVNHFNDENNSLINRETIITIMLNTILNCIGYNK